MVGQKVRVKQGKDFSIIYEKIRLIDKKIELFEEQMIKLKKEDKRKLSSFRRFKCLFKSQKLDPLVNTYQRDIWTLQSERRSLIDLFRGYNVETDDVLVLDTADVMEYVAWLDNQDHEGNKHKVFKILSKLKMDSNSILYGWLNELKQDFLKDYNAPNRKSDI